MNKRIVYQNDEGGISIIVPADCGLTIEEIAAKDNTMTTNLKGNNYGL